MGVSYRTQAGSTPDLCFVSTHARDVEPPFHLTGVVVVIVVDVAVSGDVCWNVCRLE